MPRYLTITDYATEAGVRRQTVEARIKSGLLTPVPIPDVAGKQRVYIDAEAQPPARIRAPRKPKT